MQRILEDERSEWDIVPTIISDLQGLIGALSKRDSDQCKSRSYHHFLIFECNYW